MANFEFNTVEEALADLKQGKMIIIADDENRENEGDVICPAEFIDTDKVNFMIRECRGLVCLTITKNKADKLNLSDMVLKNTDVKGTAFTQSIDADPKYEVTTGISAFDRAKTIQVAIADDAKPEDLRRPGHIFPLIAKQGGVLERVGHTEASVDLMKMAGLKPSGVICEVVKDDGSMARRDDLALFAKKFNMKFITVAQIISYRLKNEKFVRREAEAHLPTRFGDFKIYAYRNILNGHEHVALVKDDGSNKIPLVRMHSECLTGDVFESLRCDCNAQLHEALKKVEAYGKGAVVYLKDHEGRGIGLVNKVKAYALQENGEDTVDANLKLGFEPDLRTYGVGAQILLDLGFTEFKLLTNNPTKIIGLQGYGLKIVERVPTSVFRTNENEFYLKTKTERMHHEMNLSEV